MPIFFSWKLNMTASYVVAFSLDWNDFNLLYLCPPFSLLFRCVPNVKKNEAQEILIDPLLETRIWFRLLLKLLIQYVDDPVILPKPKHFWNYWERIKWSFSQQKDNKCMQSIRSTFLFIFIVSTRATTNTRNILKIESMDWFWIVTSLVLK